MHFNDVGEVLEVFLLEFDRAGLYYGHGDDAGFHRLNIADRYPILRRTANLCPIECIRERCLLQI